MKALANTLEFVIHLTSASSTHGVDADHQLAALVEFLTAGGDVPAD